jgi:hypothetical protein
MALAMLSGSACGRDVRVRVDVATNYVPQLEFDRVEVSFFGGSIRTESAAASRSTQEWFEGVRVAALEDAPSQTRFVVRLVRGDDVLAERRVSARVRRGAVIRVVLSRDCLGVSCPLAGDSPSAIACLGGMCVTEDCVDGTEPSCPPVSCADDGACSTTPTPACARPVCFAGTCAATSACAEGFGCDFARGACVSLDESIDAGPEDAGPEDAGRDASDDVGVDAPVDAGAACVIDTTDVVAWYDFSPDAPLEDVVGVAPLQRAPGDSEPLCSGGPVGSCESSLAFSACSASYLVAPDTSALAVPNGSFDLYLRLSESSTEEGVVCRDRGGPGGHICLWRTADDVLVLRQQQPSGQFAIRCAGPLPRDEWVRVGVNFGEAGPELWVDGVLGALDRPVRILLSEFTCGFGDVRSGLEPGVDLILGANNANTIPDLPARNLAIGSLRFSRVTRRYE